MRKALVLGTVALSVVALAATAASAQAAPVTGNTTVALTVFDGTLAIVTTAAAAGASSTLINTSREIASSLGLTTITDTRAASTGWTLTASTTDFTNNVPVPAVTIPKASAKFSVPSAPTTTFGTATYTYTSTPSSSGNLAVANASGVHTTQLTPLLTVAVPNTAATGLYTGTVTQSVV